MFISSFATYFAWLSSTWSSDTRKGRNCTCAQCIPTVVTERSLVAPVAMGLIPSKCMPCNFAMSSPRSVQLVVEQVFGRSGQAWDSQRWDYSETAQCIKVQQVWFSDHLTETVKQTFYSIRRAPVVKLYCTKLSRLINRINYNNYSSDMLMYLSINKSFKLNGLLLWSCHFPTGSGVVLHYIDSWSLRFFILSSPSSTLPIGGIFQIPIF